MKKNKDENINKPVAKKKVNKKLLCLCVFFVTMLICIMASVLSTASETINIEVGDIADRTITAPYDVVDEYSTNMLKEEEMQKVAPVYTTDDEETESSKQRVLDAFSQVETARTTAKDIYLEHYRTLTALDFNEAAINWSTELTVQDIEDILAKLPDYFDKNDVYIIASLSRDKLTALKDTTYRLLCEELDKGIISENITTAYDNINSSLLHTGSFTADVCEISSKIISNNVTANKIFDADATEAAKEATAQSVTPIEYKKGENIVIQGEKITQRQFELIKQLGLTSDDNSIASRWIVATVMFFLLFALGYFYLSVNDKQYINNFKDALNMSLLILLIAVLSLFAKRISPYIIPVSLAVIVGASFMMRRLTISFGCFLSIVSAFIISPSNMYIFNETVLVHMLAGAFGSTVAIMMLKKKQHRGEYILAGLLSGFVSSVTYVAYGIAIGGDAITILKMMAYAVASGLASGLLSVGVLPVWELMFSLATPSKLLELANPGSPLLKRLMIEAPGTYHHCAVTANLSEAGCEALNGDALLARVSAYYHDIGKLYAPEMFKENQMGGENPHDKLKPIESAEVLRNHVINGAKLADKYKLPGKIKNIIVQHHGNSTMQYFLYQAKQAGEVNEKDFRYPGPRPQTLEAGVVMLADVVEAAVRANQATLKRGDYKPFIYKLVKAKYDDGQLDTCPMNRRDIELVINAFVNVYEGANHERVLYPEDKK